MGYTDQPVLKGISLQIRRGEFVGILGPNGSGKTTLLLTLSGVIPVQRGTITIAGMPLKRLKPKERARAMAVVAQDSDIRFPFACREVVLMGRYPHQKAWQWDQVEDEAVVDRVMTKTDTEMLAERLITGISGGERQRVLMAKALAQETPVLLLDEATSAMDIHRKLQIFRVLRELNETEGLTVVSVLHDVNLAALFCRRLVFLKNGAIEADGQLEDVLTAQTLQNVYDTTAIVQPIAGTGKCQVSFLP
ncbi:MAG: ABC transporter ATP-binding protein [Syntrophobacteraceae bacterium]